MMNTDMKIMLLITVISVVTAAFGFSVIINPF